MKNDHLFIFILVLLVLSLQTSVWGQHCHVNAGNGILEGVDNRYPGGSTANLLDEKETQGLDANGGFSAGEPKVIKTEEPGGGFSAEEPKVVTTGEPDGGFSAEELRVVNTEEPDGGFSSGEWRTTRTTQGKTPRRSKPSRRTVRTRQTYDRDWNFDADFNDPFFHEPVPQYYYPQPRQPFRWGTGRYVTPPKLPYMGPPKH